MSDPSGFFDPEEEEAAAAAKAAGRLSLPDTSGGRSGTGLNGTDQESPTAGRRERHPRRAQGSEPKPEGGTRSPSLGTWSLILVALGVIASPVCLYLSLAELHLLSLDPVGNALRFLTLGTITSLLVVVGGGFALTAVLRGQPRARPVTALAIAFLAGPLLTMAGASLGLDTAQDTLRSELGSTAGRGASDLAEELKAQGVAFGPLDPLVEILLEANLEESE